jgi:FdhD protein
MDDSLSTGASRNSQTVVRWRDGKLERIADELAVEQPLEIRVRGRAISVTMRTPGHDEELAAGFLLTENVISTAGEVLKISICDRNEEGNVVNVQLAPEVKVDFQSLTRHVFASSSCGLCGKATIDAVAQRFAPVTSDAVFSARMIALLPEHMRSSQETFDRTGGLHAAAIFDHGGNLLILREDVGRHNAVDKVLGHAVLNGWLPLNRHILLVSGRSSFEIMQKSLAAGLPVVAAVSAPSSLAVEFAEQNGQTLVGFLRENRMNVYSHPRRVLFDSVSADTTLAILAGGEGSRMGRPKALLSVGDRPILQHILDRARWPGPTMLVTSPGRQSPPGTELFDIEAADPIAGVGPMRGALTALENAATEQVIVSAVDMPSIASEIFQFLAEQLHQRPEALAVMIRRARQNGVTIEPLPAAFRIGARNLLQERLARSKASLRELTECADVHVVDAPESWPSTIWTNLNFPEDVKHWQSIAGMKSD